MIHLVTGRLSDQAKLVKSGSAYGNRYQIYFDANPPHGAHGSRQGPFSVVTCYTYPAHTNREGVFRPAGEECEQTARTATIERGVEKAHAYLATLWQIDTGIGKWGRPWKRRSGVAFEENPLSGRSIAMTAAGVALLGGLVYALWPKKAGAAPGPGPTPTPAPGGGGTPTPPGGQPQLEPPPPGGPGGKGGGGGTTGPGTPGGQPQTAPGGYHLPIPPLPVGGGGSGGGGILPQQQNPGVPGGGKPPSQYNPSPSPFPSGIHLGPLPPVPPAPPPPDHPNTVVANEAWSVGTANSPIALHVGDVLVIDLRAAGYFSLISLPDKNVLTVAAQLGSGVFTAIGTGDTFMAWRSGAETLWFEIVVQ